MKPLDKEYCRREALKFNDKSSFQAGSLNAYRSASRRGFLDEICAHMTPKLERWDIEKIKSFASQCKTRVEFKARHKKAHSAAQRMGVLDEVCAHMKVLRKKEYSIEEMRELVATFNNFARLCTDGKGLYLAIRRRGLIDELCSDLKKRTAWTLDDARSVAKNYSSRTVFADEQPGAWAFLQRNGHLVDATAHMDGGKSGFRWDKPAILYYLKLEHVIFGTLYKIGVTNRDVKRRFYKEDARITVLMERRFDTGAEAQRIETETLKTFRDKIYVGDPILRGKGNTEIFTEDVLGLDSPTAIAA